MSHRQRPTASPSVPPPPRRSVPAAPVALASPASPAAAPAPAAPEDASPCGEHAVEGLARAYGATDAEVASLVGQIPQEAIAAAGSRGATVSVCDEAFALATTARAFFQGTEPATVARLRMGEGVVRVLVACAARASAAARDHQGRRVELRTTAPEEAAARALALTQARAGARQLANSLRGACAGDPVARERIRVAEQPRRAGHPDAGPGRALASLVAVARGFLADPTHAPTADAWGLAPTWLDELDALAAAAQRATAANETPAPLNLDLSGQRHWRGLTVLLLRRVFSAFAAASEVDARIPSPTPRHLRPAVLGRRPAGKSRAAKATAPGQPTATKPTPTKRTRGAKPAAPPAGPATPAASETASAPVAPPATPAPTA